MEPGGPRSGRAPLGRSAGRASGGPDAGGCARRSPRGRGGWRRPGSRGAHPAHLAGRAWLPGTGRPGTRHRRRGQPYPAYGQASPAHGNSRTGRGGTAASWPDGGGQGRRYCGRDRGSWRDRGRASACGVYGRPGASCGPSRGRSLGAGGSAMAHRARGRVEAGPGRGGRRRRDLTAVGGVAAGEAPTAGPGRRGPAGRRGRRAPRRAPRGAAGASEGRARGPRGGETPGSGLGASAPRASALRGLGHSHSLDATPSGTTESVKGPS